MNRPTRITMWGCAFCLVLAGFYGCKAQAEPRRMYGGGTVTCAEWQNYRTLGPKFHEIQSQAWIDGYLSGYNVGYGGQDFLLSGSSPVAFYAWIDNYCAGHPLDQLVMATTSLVQELVNRSKR